MAAESDTKQEALTYLLIADGALVRAKSAVGEKAEGNELADLIRTAGETVRQAECQLWPECDPWALVREGIW